MKSRLVKRNDKYQLLIFNGKIKTLSFDEAVNYIKTYDDPHHYIEEGKWDYPVSMEEFDGKTLAVVTKKGILEIHNASFFRDILKPEKIRYLSVVEYAEKHGKKGGIIRRLCKENRLKGAFVSGGSWMIPENCPYPADVRYGSRKNPSDE